MSELSDTETGQSRRSMTSTREIDLDGMQISTTKLNRDVMLVAGALRSGEKDLGEIVGRLRAGDADVAEILGQLRNGALDVSRSAAARRLGKTSQRALAALVDLQSGKPALLKSLAGLAARENWQELLKTA